MSAEENNSEKVHLILPEYNSEEKIDSVNKLLNTLSQRRKIGIIVGVLLIFQKYNYNKILKDFVLKEMQKYILDNPKKLISFNGTPFTADNCYVGMKAVYGKRRLIEKLIINGAEYLSVNLKHINNYLSEEIGKICFRPKGSIPIHSALIDDPFYQRQSNNNNDNFNFNLINKKRKNVEYNYTINSANSVNSINSINSVNDLSYDDEDVISDTHLMGGKIINLEDSFDEIEINENSNINNNKNSYISKNNSDNENLYTNNDSKIEKNKYDLEDILTINNFSNSGPLHTYLNDNKNNILKLYNIFSSLETIGIKGQNDLDNLNKIISLFNKESEKDENKNEKLKEIYDKYEDKKINLIRVYKRIESISYIMQGITKKNNISVNSDIDYLNKNYKNYEKKINDIFPLFHKILKSTHQFELIKLIDSIKELSFNLKDNEFEFNLFQNFTQNVLSRVPEQIIKEKNEFCDDYIKGINNDDKLKENFINILKKEGHKLIEDAINDK